MVRRSIYGFFAFAGAAVLSAGAMLAVASCELNEDLINTRDAIRRDLNGQGVYERNNLPLDQDEIRGYYDRIDGAFRHIVNEDRASRGQSPGILKGNRISFYFDARVYSGRFDGSKTFWTNRKDRMSEIAGENPTIYDEDSPFWSDEPKEIVLGSDTDILKPIQSALIGCRADNGNPADDEDGGITSDVVRVYLPYDVAFGNRWVGIVPPKSTLVWEISGIQILD